MSAVQGFFTAVRFLTLIPLGSSGAFDPKAIAAYFPAVGLLVGLLLAVVDLGARWLWPDHVAAVVDVVFLALITGGFHLDGLGDAADGLLGHRSPEKAMAIMKDSRIGVMGLLAICGALALKWGGISALQSQRTYMLVLIPAFARSAMLFGIWGLPYGRPQGGTGHALFDEPLKIRAFWGVGLLVLASLFAGGRGLVLIGLFCGITLAVVLYYRRRMGVVTGDMLGAMAEINEALLFLFIAIGGG